MSLLPSTSFIDSFARVAPSCRLTVLGGIWEPLVAQQQLYRCSYTVIVMHAAYRCFYEYSRAFCLLRTVFWFFNLPFTVMNIICYMYRSFRSLLKYESPTRLVFDQLLCQQYLESLLVGLLANVLCSVRMSRVPRLFYRLRNPEHLEKRSRAARYPHTSI